MKSLNKVDVFGGCHFLICLFAILWKMAAW